ncbi:hypothetical protein LK540_08425 [Massilia sp. IC2-278]|uniref:6-pyruvoyl-tetrahydropterin synthase-related protein n=1 Tax=Massilia sp. IC2-278 TaxID=2887200 RepID=UPI001E3AC7DB|nr:6-pyruvoyl-tetrahydropterin synthase-related protein [Massilia sp. IC2-278]MCC2960455.1 hypothetical protein [Massilia sp. IC2-278]
MTLARRPSWPGLLAIVAMSLLLWLYALATLRLPYQVDMLVHLRWAEQFLAALREGWLLPRWAYASIEGLGDPTFFYYQPLFYYVTSGLRLLGLRSEAALVGAAMVPSLLLGIVVRQRFLHAYRPGPALAGTLFVLACPVLLFLAVQMAAYPWTLALPFCLLFVAESIRTGPGEQPRAPHLAVLLALVCLSHLLSALMVLACTGLARLALAWPNRRTLASHLHWSAGVVLGLGLAAFFVWPAVTQLHLINPDGWTGGANFDWRRAFALPTFSFLAHGFRWFAIQGPLSLLALVLCLFVLYSSRRAATPGSARARKLAVAALAAMLLASELAYPLYALLEPMRKIQFPYRFMFLALLLANIALVIELNEGAWRRWNTLLRVLAVALMAAQCAMTLQLQLGIVRGGKPIPEAASFMQGRFGQPEYIPAVRGPEWKAYLAGGKLDGECARLGIACSQTLNRTHELAFVIDTPRPVALRLPLLAYPAWAMTVDGERRPLAADPATGLALANLSSGRHTVALSWVGLPAETAGRIASALACVAWLVWFLVLRRRARTAPAAVDAGAKAGRLMHTG